MLAPQSGQTRLRIAEMKLMLAFLTTVNEAIVSLPFFRRFFTAEYTNLKRWAAGAFWVGRSVERAAAPRFRIQTLRATELPIALLGTYRLRTRFIWSA
jgi:hypothetical protein